MTANPELLTMTAQIVAAYVGNNTIPVAQIKDLTSSVYNTMRGLESDDAEAPAAGMRPAVPIKKSVTPDYIVCLEDGKRLKMLKRHLRTAYDLTPEQYRKKWGLPADYPMTAPNYAERRSQFAKAIGLGHHAKGGRKAKR